MSANKIHLSGERYIRIDECAKVVRRLHEAYYELAWRKDWLLWHVQEFRHEFIEMSKCVNFEPWGEKFDWLAISAFCNEESCYRHEMGKAFARKYELPCYRHGVQVELRLLNEVAELVKQAKKHDFGLEVENFRRDKEWYELHEDWLEFPQDYREVIAEALVASDIHLSKKRRDKKKEKLISGEKPPYREVARLTYGKFAVAIDRIVLQGLIKQRHQILDEVDSKQDYLRMEDNAEWRDCRLLYRLGILKKVRALYSAVAAIPEIEVFPVKLDGERLIVDGEHYFVRYNYPIEGYGMFELVDEWKAKGREDLRGRFLEQRELYYNRFGGEQIESLIRNAIRNMKKRIRNLRLFYFRQAKP